MSKRSKFMNRIMVIVLLTLCFQGCLNFNSTLFARGTEVEIQDVTVSRGIEIDASMSTNTTSPSQ